MCDRVAVMYLGKIVELRRPTTLYAHPRHPYTGALLSAVPVPDPRLAQAEDAAGARRRRAAPDRRRRAGCRFHTRCPKAQEVCAQRRAAARAQGRAARLAACHFPLSSEDVAKPVPTAAG